MPPKRRRTSRSITKRSTKVAPPPPPASLPVFDAIIPEYYCSNVSRQPPPPPPPPLSTSEDPELPPPGKKKKIIKQEPTTTAAAEKSTTQQQKVCTAECCQGKPEDLLLIIRCDMCEILYCNGCWDGTMCYGEGCTTAFCDSCTNICARDGFDHPLAVCGGKVPCDGPCYQQFCYDGGCYKKYMIKHKIVEGCELNNELICRTHIKKCVHCDNTELCYECPKTRTYQCTKCNSWKYDYNLEKPTCKCRVRTRKIGSKWIELNPEERPEWKIIEPIICLQCSGQGINDSSSLSSD